MTKKEEALIRHAFLTGMEVFENDHTYYFWAKGYDTVEEVLEVYLASVKRRKKRN